MKAPLLSLGILCLASTLANADLMSPEEASDEQLPKTDAISPTNHTEVIKVWVDQTGEIFLDGHPVQSIEALTNQLAQAVDKNTLIALNTALSNQHQTVTYLDVFKKLAEMSQPLLVVEQDGSQTLPSKEDTDSLSTFSLNSKQFQKIHNVYRRLSHQNESNDSIPTLGLTFSMDEDSQTYSLHGLNLELPGRNLWIVGEALDEEEPEATIQSKKTW